MYLDNFRRVEKKYLLTEDDFNKLMDKIKDKLVENEYFVSNIINIYYDTVNDDLINISIDKPIYKEKVRIRSYFVPKVDDYVFLEIKKKYKGVVGKRRIKIKLKDFYNNDFSSDNEQISKEIKYCFDNYKLVPKLMIAYDRLSYVGKEDFNLRITFDTNLRSRTKNLKLEKGSMGTNYFKDNTYIMEVKTLNSLPLWFIRSLEELNIYPTSFSKYGSIYKEMIKNV